MESWGRYPKVAQREIPLLDEARFFESVSKDDSFLPVGLGRSYGDSCLAASGQQLLARYSDRFISYDSEQGILRCAAGVSLAAILARVTRDGWFLPVTPGTKFVTVAGAIANDVHGKNHHQAGSFGCHVRCFGLLRSDGKIYECSETDNAALFSATIGGLGLTGVILWAEVQLKKVANAAVRCETIKYKHLNDFFQLTEDSASSHEYTVAWLDCLATGTQLGRGHFMRANHASATDPSPLPSQRKLTVPFAPPISAINAISLRLFNTLYYHRQCAEKKHQLMGYDPFFYPLDAIHHWNRIYGPRGFQQYQCVIPEPDARDATAAMLSEISASKTGSPLIVLKTFGNKTSPGMLSFPRPGVTLALDFPMQGAKTEALFSRLDAIVLQAKGTLYPAKDAHMSSELFLQGYSKLEAFKEYKDPAIESLFWQRVVGNS